METKLDSDFPTLHIRCGSDIRDKLKTAGFSGDFLEYSDPICQGPVPDSPGFHEQRARFLLDAYGGYMGFTEAQALARLQDEDKRLAAAHQVPRVVLWFEHDSYDQLVLARCLARFAAGPRPPHLELICIDRHPDVPRFIGLGQLEASALAALWPQRKTVTADQIALGQAIWTALRRPDPTVLQEIAATGTPALPIAAPALRRHLRELPGTTDGLSLTQRLVLDVLAEAPATIGRIFSTLMNEREPLPFLGDIQLLAVIEDMARADPPVLTIGPNERPFQRMVSMTETGRRVYGGETDYLSLKIPERWVGGVRVAPGQPTWRFEALNGAVSYSG